VSSLGFPFTHSSPSSFLSQFLPILDNYTSKNLLLRTVVSTDRRPSRSL
jgi:hypothetical protein